MIKQIIRMIRGMVLHTDTVSHTHTHTHTKVPSYQILSRILYANGITQKG